MLCLETNGSKGQSKAGRKTCGSVARSTRLISGLARLGFLTSWASILARYINELAREPARAGLWAKRAEQGY